MFEQSSEAAAHNSMTALMPEFLLLAEVELRFSKETIAKYGECLKQVSTHFGDRPISEFQRSDLLALKSQFLAKDLSVSRQASILLAFKRFLQFCSEEKGIEVFDFHEIAAPRRPRRDVLFLTTKEVERLVASIPLLTYHGQPHMAGLRLRAVIEALLGSGLRIGELLSLDRERIDFKNKEAKVIGKGNKERSAFFTDRALFWIKKYLDAREDKEQALFVCQDGRTPLRRDDLWRYFKRYRILAGIQKKVTPHSGKSKITRSRKQAQQSSNSDIDLRRIHICGICVD
jgi:integrase/recombinase XerD